MIECETRKCKKTEFNGTELQFKMAPKQNCLYGFDWDHSNKQEDWYSPWLTQISIYCIVCFIVLSEFRTSKIELVKYSCFSFELHLFKIAQYFFSRNTKNDNNYFFSFSLGKYSYSDDISTIVYNHTFI